MPTLTLVFYVDIVTDLNASSTFTGPVSARTKKKKKIDYVEKIGLVYMRLLFFSFFL